MLGYNFIAQFENAQNLKHFTSTEHTRAFRINYK